MATAQVPTEAEIVAFLEIWPQLSTAIFMLGLGILTEETSPFNVSLDAEQGVIGWSA